MLRVVRIKDLRESVFNTFIKGCVTLNTPQLFDRARDEPLSFYPGAQRRL